MKRIFLFFTIIVLFAACGDVETFHETSLPSPRHSDNQMRFAQNVVVNETDSGYLISVRNPWDTTAWLGQYMVNQPFERVVCYSSTQWSVFDKLGEIERVKGILEGRYVTDSTMRALLDTGSVQDVGTEAQVNSERLIALQPDIILYTPYSGGGDVPQHVSTMPNTIMFPFADYLETEPLGRAEWIRVVGILCGRKEEADAWFDQIECRYLSLKTLCDSVEERPTVFSDLPFNGQWYVAGGKSYIAQLFADAGADYLWADNDKTGSVPLDFEPILAKAQHADFWRVSNSALQVMTYATLERESNLYALFDAFNQHQMLVCDVVQTGYFERSAMEPDVLLADFIYFFHPELLKGEWEGYKPKYYHWMSQ